MASTCKLYKGPLEIGSGACAAGSTSITSYTATAGGVAVRRNLTIAITQAGIHAGRTWRTRVLADNGSGTLTLADPCPFVAA
jgi:hypothetical protein